MAPGRAARGGRPSGRDYCPRPGHARSARQHAAPRTSRSHRRRHRPWTRSATTGRATARWRAARPAGPRPPGPTTTTALPCGAVWPASRVLAAPAVWPRQPLVWLWVLRLIARAAPQARVLWSLALTCVSSCVLPLLAPEQVATHHRRPPSLERILQCATPFVGSSPAHASHGLPLLSLHAIRPPSFLVRTASS